MIVTSQIEAEYRDRWRIWFAWYPVRVWKRQPNQYRSLSRWAWFERVVQVRGARAHEVGCRVTQNNDGSFKHCTCGAGLGHGWRAYDEHQEVLEERKWVKDDAR